MRELSAYPAEPNQIKGKIKRSTEVMDLLFFIFVHPSLINMHNKYFWTSTLLGVPRWESLMRINNLVETLFTILFLLPIKAVTKTEAPPCYTLGETTPSEMFTVCKYSRPWREKESENNADWPTQWRTGNDTHESWSDWDMSSAILGLQSYLKRCMILLLTSRHYTRQGKAVVW